VGRTERRKRETWLQFLWGLGDVAATVAAFLLAYWIRFHSPFTDLVPVTKGVPAVGPYLTAGLFLGVVILPVLASLGLYRVELVSLPLQKSFRLVRGAGVAVIIGAAFGFFYREFSFSRAFFPVLYVCLIAFLLLGRGLIAGVSRAWRRGSPLRVVVAGQSPSGRQLVERLAEGDPTGVSVIGILTLDGPTGGASRAAVSGGGTSAEAPDPGRGLPPAVSRPILGSYAEAARVVTEHRVDILLLCLPLDEQHHAGALVAECQGLSTDLELVPDLLQLLSRRSRVRELDGIPVLSLREIPLSGWAAVQKRTFDLVCSGLGLLALSPLFLVLAILVRITSPGPVFYRQERLGRDGRHFKILKLRSMRSDAEATSGPVWASKGDERRTPIGSFLREWSLDELPQLWNVFRGEMSLVGPRPERPHFVDRFARDLPAYLDRHRVKSGITGWAQVNGLRGDTSIEERTRYDLFYVENWSVALDVKILLLTVAAVFRRTGAY
jgi:exopolysaccharide biosynthesis polyprenyl glycosylphosphotransferase